MFILNNIHMIYQRKCKQKIRKEFNLRGVSWNSYTRLNLNVELNGTKIFVLSSTFGGDFNVIFAK